MWTFTVSFVMKIFPALSGRGILRDFVPTDSAHDVGRTNLFHRIRSGPHHQPIYPRCPLANRTGVVFRKLMVSDITRRFPAHSGLPVFTFFPPQRSKTLQENGSSVLGQLCGTPPPRHHPSLRTLLPLPPSPVTVVLWIYHHPSSHPPSVGVG